MDTVFVLVSIIAFSLSQKNWKTLQTTFGLTNTFFLCCAGAYVLSGIVGYALHSPMQTNEWIKIADLRWFFGLFACYSVGHTLSSRKKTFNWYFIAWIATSICIIYRHYQITSGRLFDPDYRLQGFYSNPNYYALAVVLVWSTMIAFVLYAKNWQTRLCAGVALALSTTTLIATYTRTSWIGMFCVLLAAIYLTKNKKVALVSGLAFSLFLAAIALNLFELRDRILYTFNFSGTNSQIARLTVWKVNWQLFLDYPMFGVGFENSAKLYHGYYSRMGHHNEYMPGHAHNQFLNVLTGAGIVGLLAYLSIFGSAVVYFHRRLKTSVEIHQKQLSLGALLCIVALFACSWTETPLIQHEARNYILILLGFSYGYLDGIPKQQTKPQNEPA